MTPLVLGSRVVDPPVVLAPMAGVTNAPFRTLCRRFGPGLVYVNEMVMATGLVRGGRKSESLVSFAPDEEFRSLQLYGSDPEMIGAAVEMLGSRGAVDHVDLNFGCPAPKVTRRGGGAAVPVKRRLLAAIVGSAGVPTALRTKVRLVPTAGDAPWRPEFDAALGTPGGDGRGPGLVEQAGGLLDAARDGVGDGRLAEGQRVFGMGVEKGPARRGRLGELLGGKFEFRAGGHQAGAAGMLVGQPLHLVERRGDLIALDEPVELLEVADQFGATELDLLAGAARAGSVGVDRHRLLRRCVPPPSGAATP